VEHFYISMLKHDNASLRFFEVVASFIEELGQTAEHQFMHLVVCVANFDD
jgi:hypothetical protein